MQRKRIRNSLKKRMRQSSLENNELSKLSQRVEYNYTAEEEKIIKAMSPDQNRSEVISTIDHNTISNRGKTIE